MGDVGRSVTTAVKNVTQTITKPITTLITQPSKLNIGDIAVLGTAGLAAPTVNAIRHPGDIPTEAAVITGGALAVHALTAPALAAAPAASSTEAAVSSFSAPSSAGAYTGSFAAGGGGGGPGLGLIGTSGPLDLNYVAPVTANATGSVASGGGLFSFLGKAGSAATSLFSPILSSVGKAATALIPSLAGWSLFQSLNRGNSSGPGQSNTSPPPVGSADSGITGTPGTIGGGAGPGYGPYGTALPTPGTPGSSDATPSLLTATSSPSNLTFYFLMGLAVLAGWYFFILKRKHA